MDWLTFVLGLIKALAWPVVVGGFLILTRAQIGSLLSRLIELTFPGGSVKFESRLAEAKVAGDIAIKATTEVTTNQTKSILAPDETEALPMLKEFRLSDATLKAAYLDPKNTVIASFSRVEREIEKILSPDSPPKDRENSPITAVEVEQLMSNGTIPELTYNWFKKLRDLRNVAMFGLQNEITPEEAIDYRLQCDRFIYHLHALSSASGSPS